MLKLQAITPTARHHICKCQTPLVMIWSANPDDINWSGRAPSSDSATSPHQDTKLTAAAVLPSWRCKTLHQGCRPGLQARNARAPETMYQQSYKSSLSSQARLSQRGPQSQRSQPGNTRACCGCGRPPTLPKQILLLSQVCTSAVLRAWLVLWLLSMSETLNLPSDRLI